MIIDKIPHYFDFDKHQTNFRTELLAGLSTFLSMAYIFVVNPSILSEGGINKSAALFATVIVSATATIVMGIWAKKPFALAPGLEINSYVVYFLIIGLGVSWQASLGLVFWSGVLFFVLTISNLRTKLIDAIPSTLKTGLAAAVGVFLIIIAFRISGILKYDKVKLVGISDPFGFNGLILLTGLIITTGLRRLRSKYFILASIIVCTIISHYTGLAKSVQSVVGLNKSMFSAVGKFDIGAILRPKLWSPLLILFVIDFYGSIAKFIGLTKNTSIVENGKLPKMKEALLIDGGAIAAGAALGTTSIVVFVESGVGIGAGGRTGLVAVFCGILMLFFIPLAPILNEVPVIATAGVLLWVGLWLMPNLLVIRLMSKVELITVASMVVLTAYTFALDTAMLVGFTVYVLGMLITGQNKKVNVYLVASIIIIFTSTLLSMYYA